MRADVAHGPLRLHEIDAQQLEHGFGRRDLKKEKKKETRRGEDEKETRRGEDEKDERRKELVRLERKIAEALNGKFYTPSSYPSDR
jgi:ribosomal protein L2